MCRFFYAIIVTMQMRIDSDGFPMAAAAAGGLLLTAAFPKLSLDMLVWVALVPILFFLRDLSAKKGFRIGFTAGLVHYLTLLYWLVGTMDTYGQLPFVLSVSILFCLAAYLALYFALFCAAITRLTRRPSVFLIGAPALWVSLEYLRTHLLSGFPWGLVGYTLFKRLSMIQIADLAGVYGVSFVIVLVNAAVTLILQRKRAWPTRPVSGPLVMGVAVSAVLVMVWGYGTWRIGHFASVEKQVSGVPVAVVQGNIDQARKWDPAFQAATVDKYIRLSRLTLAQHPDLVVWPETATPFYLFSEPALTDRVMDAIGQCGTDFLIGSPSFSIDGKTYAYHNSAYLIGASGQLLGKYDKVHLVPFGEYVPLKKYLPFLGKIVAQVGDFRPGTKGKTLPWGHRQIGMLICYELIFPDLARSMVRNGADILANITNDAWFSTSSGPYQHFSMAVFRAVENRRSLVRAANTGISGFVFPTGSIHEETALFTDDERVCRIPIETSVSFYTRSGDLFSIGCLVLCLSLLAAGRIRRR
jgi:apolipoprotein N-acyltransferase